MKRCNLFFFLSVLCFLSPLALHAQQLLKKPLRFADADSVIFFDTDKTNLSVTARAVDQSIKATPWTIAAKRDVAASLNLASKPVAQCDSLLLLPRDAAFYQCEKRMQQFASALAWTGDARYADGVEQLVYNFLLPQASTPSFEQHQAARLLAKVPALAYMTDGAQLYVNLFFNGYASVRVGNDLLHIDQLTHAPFAPQLRFRLTGFKGTTRLTLRVRLPFYHEGTLSLFINGHDETYPVEKGYIVIDRYWNNRDELFFDLRYAPRLLPHAQQRIARLGALLYRAKAPLSLPLFFADEPNSEGHRCLRDSTQITTLLMDD